LVSLIKINTMAKNTSILLGDYFDNFISQQIKSGKFSSASEVVRTALRMFEHEESKKTELINELKKGEKSGFVENFDRKEFLKNLHQKHSAD
jgi:antitoxin ParD1/3/4